MMNGLPILKAGHYYRFKNRASQFIPSVGFITVTNLEMKTN